MRIRDLQSFLMGETDHGITWSCSDGGGMGQQWPAAGLGTLGAAVCAWNLLKKATIIFITSTIVWPQVKQQGALPINRKLD